MFYWGSMSDIEITRACYRSVLECAETARAAAQEAADCAWYAGRAQSAAAAADDWRRAERAAHRAEQAADRATQAAEEIAPLAPEAARAARRGEYLRAQFADEIGTAAYNALLTAHDAREHARTAQGDAMRAGLSAQETARALALG